MRAGVFGALPPAPPALLLLLTLTVTPPAAAQTDAAIAAARAGGVTLLCRHAITGNFQEREPVDYADTTTQRLLSPEGERQSRRMGDALRALGIVPAELVASPMSRAKWTAWLMFPELETVIDSAWHTNGSDFSGPPATRRAEVLASPISGGVRLISSHLGTMRNALNGNPGDVDEGDCVVVRPDGEAHEIVGVVPWRRWLRESRARDAHRVQITMLPHARVGRLY